MKRQVQEIGIRRWFGDDFINLQNELYEALEGFFEPYGNMIIKGCSISDIGGSWQIAAGLVGLYSPTGDEYRVCRVAQTDVLDANTSVYLTLTSETTTRPYKAGGSLTVVKEYKALISTVQPGSGEYLTINANGNNVTFREGLQNAIYRFVTDAEKAAWNAKEPAITKKSGFNLDKSDSISTANSATLATSTAVKSAYDRGSTGVNDAANALDVANSKEPKITKKTAFNKDFGINAGQVAEGDKYPLLGVYSQGDIFIDSLEEKKIKSITDGNAINVSGRYKVGSTWNGSPKIGTQGGNQGYLINMIWGDAIAYRIQVFVDINSDFRLLIRRDNNGAWSGWRSIITELDNGNVPIGKLIASEKVDVDGSVKANDFIIS